MNANELADYLENDFQIQEAVIDMLRQQVDEIKLLRQGMKDGFDGLETMTELCKTQADEIVKLKRFIDERGETGQLIIWKTKQ